MKRRRILIAFFTSVFVLIVCLETSHGPLISNQVNSRLKLNIGQFHGTDLEHGEDGAAGQDNDWRFGFGQPEEREVGIVREHDRRVGFGQPEEREVGLVQEHDRRIGFGHQPEESERGVGLENADRKFEFSRLLKDKFVLQVPEQRHQELVEREHSLPDGNVGLSTTGTGRYGKPVYGSVMNQIIIFNAVPKSGSKTFTYLLMEKLYLQRIPMGIYRMLPNGKTDSAKRSIAGDGTLPQSYKEKLKFDEKHIPAIVGAANTIPKVLRKENPPLYMSGHFFLPDVPDDMKPAPIFINMIRDPLERFSSSFYWKASGDTIRGTDRRGITKSFDKCIRRGLRTCMSPHMFAHQRLCGKGKRCSSDSRWAVERAKENVDRVYTFIGISEEFETSLRIFERLVPDVFGGVVDHYKRGIGVDYTNLTATKSKGELSPYMAEMARRQLVEEYELYNYIYDKFQRMKQRYGLQ